jgi:hypothetical protein
LPKPAGAATTTACAVVDALPLALQALAFQRRTRQPWRHGLQGEFGLGHRYTQKRSGAGIADAAEASEPCARERGRRVSPSPRAISRPGGSTSGCG